MQHKWMVLLSALVLLSMVIAPMSGAQAQAELQDVPPHCPPYTPGLLDETDFLRSLPTECIKTYKIAAHQANPPAIPEPNSQDFQPTWFVGKPDSFGYTYDHIAFNPISATIDSGLTGDDEFAGPIDIGFSFPFYGESQTQLYFSTNGLITFGAGSRAWNPTAIPNYVNPNRYIAPFWSDLLVGAPNGAIYYSRGGSAPNRYFVVEWRQVENFEGYGPASFEAILYENGDIVIQHIGMPSHHFSTVGIEDGSGYQGLEYQYGDQIMAGRAIRLYYPAAPAARVLAYPLQASAFAPLTGHKDFTIVVTNNGTLGTDTYNLTAPLSGWSGSYYAGDGVTPLIDTDGDSLLDTGPLPQGTSTTIIARYLVPADAAVGSVAGDSITVTSSLNNSVKTYVRPRMTIPAEFASVFMNRTDGAMSFLTASADGTNLHKATADNYFGSDVAMAQLPNGYYFYAWNRGSSIGGRWIGNIEYTLLDRNGNLVRTPAKLTDNTGAALYTWDDSPSIAGAPNGILGVVWRRYLYNNTSSKFNYNIYFATLSATGDLLTGPTNLTNNGFWGVPGTNIAPFESPTIAATSDNRFVIGWQSSNSNGHHNIRYTVRSASGSQVSAPKALTNNNHGEDPILNSLAGGRVIITWRGDMFGPYYAIISSNGAIYKPATSSTSWNGYAIADAIQLPNGKVAVAWVMNNFAVYQILNSAYNVENTSVLTGDDFDGHSLSVTTDASSRVIMTWLDGNGDNKQLYALGISAVNGGFFTDPMIYETSSDPIDVSWNGQGNAPYEPGAIATFYDVQPGHWASSYIERLYASRITGGCGTNPLQYCPESTVTRAQMAIFLLRGIHGSSYNPPAMGGSTGFGDVSTGHWAGAWIKQLAAEGITSGCGNGNYCPEASVTREQMAVFLLKAKYGSSYGPPAVNGGTGFGDVDPSHWAAAWIKQLVVEGITSGCGSNTYCPKSPVTRAQMAVFLVKTFNLP